MFAIQVQPARLQQRDAIVHFLLDHFRLEEPLCHSLHLTTFDAQRFFTDMVDHGLIRSVSFVALNDQNEIVGCRINEMIDFPPRKTSSGELGRRSQWSPTVRKLSDFLDYLCRDVEKLLPPDTKKVMKFMCISVHPDYQRRGLARQLIDASIALAVEQKCEYVFTGATAFKSQQLFEKKLGFETLRVIDYKDYLDPETKKAVFVCDDGTTCAKLMVKKLKK